MGLPKDLLCQRSLGGLYPQEAKEGRLITHPVLPVR